MSTANQHPDQFDFERHKNKVIEDYRLQQSKYESFANVVKEILRKAIPSTVKIASMESRAKSPESLGEKSITPQNDNPLRPKYADPLNDIEDIAAARVITFFLSDLHTIDEVIKRQFHVTERVDKAGHLLQGVLVGYQSIHYIVCLGTDRTSLPEYKRYDGLKAEIQLRTVLQHAWAEIEHDIQYKSKEDVPLEIRQRFANLAGLLAIADREFQSVNDEEERIRVKTAASVESGRLGNVAVTADSLKIYADVKLGEDGRISSWSYDWFARILRRLGFADLGRLDQMTRNYDDDLLSRAIHGSRQGQLSRLEDMLLVAMGEDFIESHPWAEYEWFRNGRRADLARAREALGIESHSDDR